MNRIKMLSFWFPALLLVNVSIALRHVGNNPDVHFIIRLIYLSVISPGIFVLVAVLLWLVFYRTLEYEDELERFLIKKAFPVVYALSFPSFFYNVFLLYTIMYL